MYKVFNKYALRTPLLPINYYRDLTTGLEISNDKLLNEFKNPIIREAIFLASPVLYKEIIKWSENKIEKLVEVEKIKNSFLKYLSRLSSRATPFGLFAGITLGRFANENTVEIDSSHHGRNTRLDMNLTGKLVKVLEEIPEIKNQLMYYSNTSLFKCGTKLRYVERNYDVNGLIIYQVVEVDDSEYISKVLNCVDSGFNILGLSKTIIDNYINKEDAVSFINDLIDNQILISELEQTVSGEENIDRILFVLKKMKGIDKIILTLELIKEKLSKLDLKLGNGICAYDDIIDLLASFFIGFDEKFIFQTDLVIKTKTNFLNDEIKDKLLDGLLFLNKISTNVENIHLKNFKNAFINRYQYREMPLLHVLDSEIGIGYPINIDHDENPLIKNISFKNNQRKSEKSLNLTLFHKFILKKVLGSIKDNHYIVEINENEINDLPIVWDDLTDSLSSIVQIVKIEGKLMINMSVAAGSSAGNLLGRFCYCDSEINNFVSEICEFEQNINKNKIIAEIVHLPEDRIGNVLTRPSFRDFEIPYLSRSSKIEQNIIKLEDIFVAISNDKIILKSKKLGKDIIPRLTTAHNFSLSSLPIYRFLSDMQNSEKRSYIGIDLGMIETEFSFLPRIVYKNIIVSKAKWRIDLKEFEDIFKKSNKDVLQIKEWTKEKNIPQFVYYIEDDYTLLINLHNLDTLKMFYATIRNKVNIIIEEFLFDDDGICSNDKNDIYVNEFIVSFYNDIF